MGSNSIRVSAKQYRLFMGLDKEPEKPIAAPLTAEPAPAEPDSLPAAIDAGAASQAVQTALSRPALISDYYQRLITALRLAIAVYKRAGSYACAQAFKSDLDSEAIQCERLISALEKETSRPASRTRSTFGQRSEKP